MSSKENHRGAGSDDAEVEGSDDGVVRIDVDLGTQEEGGSMLEVEHLLTELVGLGIDESKLVGKVLGEDRLDDGHLDVFNGNDRDLGVPFCW